MVEQSDFPDRWSCSSESKTVIVEVRVPDSESDTGYTWIEIPTTSVEQWVEKGEAAQIQRTAKVEFPTEWGRPEDAAETHSPKELIEQFDSTDARPFQMARIWWFDDANERWILNHFGWIGGVGQTGDTGISKFWVYDYAELLSGVPVGVTFSNPSVKQALEEIARLVNENTPVPVSDTLVMQPQTEEEFLEVARNYDAGGSAAPIGTDVVESDDDLVGPDVAFGAAPARPYYSFTNDRVVAYEEADFQSDEELAPLPREADENFGALTIRTEGKVNIFSANTKDFVANHDTLLDVFEWFEEKTGANLHFEPSGNAVILVADIVPERRIFSQREVIQESEDDYQFHRDAIVYENDALYEMKPINTLHLRGETPSGYVDAAQDFIESTMAGITGVTPADKFPVVHVEVPELIEAAEGIKLSPEVVESDARDLETAEKEAVREMSNRLSETSEGSIMLRGVAEMMPFDRLDAFEVCNDRVAFESEPVRYEVESVKHVKTSSDIYKTEVNVSIWANDENIEIVESEMVEENV